LGEGRCSLGGTEGRQDKKRGGKRVDCTQGRNVSGQKNFFEGYAKDVPKENKRVAAQGEDKYQKKVHMRDNGDQKETPRTKGTGGGGRTFCRIWSKFSFVRKLPPEREEKSNYSEGGEGRGETFRESIFTQVINKRKRAEGKTPGRGFCLLEWLLWTDFLARGTYRKGSMLPAAPRKKFRFLPRRREKRRKNPSKGSLNWTLSSPGETFFVFLPQEKERSGRQHREERGGQTKRPGLWRGSSIGKKQTAPLRSNVRFIDGRSRGQERRGCRNGGKNSFCKAVLVPGGVETA